MERKAKGIGSGVNKSRDVGPEHLPMCLLRSISGNLHHNCRRNLKHECWPGHCLCPYEMLS